MPTDLYSIAREHIEMWIADLVGTRSPYTAATFMSCARDFRVGWKTHNLVGPVARPGEDRVMTGEGITRLRDPFTL